MQATSDTLFDPLDQRKTVSVAELAEALGIERQTAYRDIKDGSIPGGFQRKPGGAWRVRRAIVEAWWAKQGK
jgi:excisionase family DNA binding protein